MENKKLLTLLEMSRTLRIPAKWLKTEALAGRIPHLKVGRKLLFNSEAVESVLAEQARAASVVHR
jgi:hypothetical protein